MIVTESHPVVVHAVEHAVLQERQHWMDAVEELAALRREVAILRHRLDQAQELHG